MRETKRPRARWYAIHAAFIGTIFLKMRLYCGNVCDSFVLAEWCQLHVVKRGWSGIKNLYEYIETVDTSGDVNCCRLNRMILNIMIHVVRISLSDMNVCSQELWYVRGSYTL